MKIILLKEMLELTKKQSEALKIDDFQVIEDIGAQILRVQEQIKEWDMHNKAKKTEEVDKILKEIQELNEVNTQLGIRKLAHIKQHLKTVRQQQRNATAYANAYGESGLFYDQK